MKKIFITFFLLAITLVGLTLYVGVSKVEPITAIESKTPYYYDRPDMPIGDISLLIFYFVPKDKMGLAIDNWKEVVETNIKELKNFHETQFYGRSNLSHEFYSETIIGEKTAKEYEINIEEHSSPEAIIPVTEEISRRVLSINGDLHKNITQDNSLKSRRVYLIIFEGEGGAGSGEFGLISRSYLTENAYSLFGTTFLAHEFYHTLGLPDNYQKSSYVYGDAQQVAISILSGKDVMGQVRVPINRTYIDRATLKKMGM